MNRITLLRLRCVPRNHARTLIILPHSFVAPYSTSTSASASASNPATPRTKTITTTEALRLTTTSSTPTAITAVRPGPLVRHIIKKPRKKKPQNEGPLIATMFVLVNTIRGWSGGAEFSSAIQHVLRPYFEGDEFFNRKWDL